jgi:hypothetical protein
LSPEDDVFVALAARVRALAEELADLAIDRLYEATEHRGADPGRAVADERRLTRAARALEKAAADLEGVRRGGPEEA